MHNLCFMSNLSSEEWAAWVQAIGSIAAIFAAIWIASRQHRNAVTRERGRQVAQAKQVARLCTLFSTQLFECLAETVDACEINNRDLVGHQFSRLQEVIEFSRAVNVAEIPGNALWPFMLLRVIAAQSRNYADSFLEAAPPPFGYLQQRIEKLLIEAGKANHEVVAAFGDEIGSTVLKVNEQARV